MMWASLDNTKMESDILRDIAVFDPNAPINVTICFEDDDETNEILIKTGNVQDTKQIGSITSLESELKKNIQEEPLTICEKTRQVNVDEGQNVLKEITTLQTEELQNKIPNSNESRKRKQMRLQIYKNKRAKSMQEISSDNRPSHINKDDGKNEKSTPISEYSLFGSEQSLSTKTNPPHLESAAEGSHPSVAPKSDAEAQAQANRLSLYIKKCLSPVSEYMRLIMDAYNNCNLHKISKEEYKALKTKLFNLSYSTVVTMLLPEEKNTDFIKTFLKETHRHSFESLSLFKHTYQDYEILLKELLSWAKHNKTLHDPAAHLKKHAAQPTNTDNDNNNARELNKPQTQKSQNNNVEVNNSAKSAEVDKICIFSSGSLGNEISINIDPVLNQCLSKNSSQKPSVNETPCKGGDRFQSQMLHVDSPVKQFESELVKCLARPPRVGVDTLVKDKNKKQKIGYLSSNDKPTPQINAQLTQAQKSLNMQLLQLPPQQPQRLQSQQGQSWSLTQYGKPAPLPQYGQSTYAPPQYVQSSHVPPQNRQYSNQLQFGQLQNQQQQLKPSKHVQPRVGQSHYVLPQYKQAQQRQYGQSQHMQLQLGQSPNFLPQSGQANLMQRQLRQFESILPQYGQSQHLPPQYGQIEQSIYGVSKLQASQVGQSQHVLDIPQYRQSKQESSQVPQSQHVLPQYEQSHHVILQSEKPQPTEWHQELNALYHQRQIPPQRGSPRAASTDSGFISPLNFNVSSDQTVQPASEPSEAATLLITHVTSLNPKVSFIEEGNCIVCKKPTKQVCMGCMECYYCTYDCQLLDWSAHEPNCKVSK